MFHLALQLNGGLVHNLNAEDYLMDVREERDGRHQLFLMYFIYTSIQADIFHLNEAIIHQGATKYYVYCPIKQNNKIMKRTNRLLYSPLLVFLLSISLSCFAQQKINLSGTWSVVLDSLDQGQYQGWFNKKFDQNITLPGTTDAAGLGVKNSLEPKLEKQQLSHLTRKNRYVGATWYSRTFDTPKSWKNKQVILNLERVLWRSQIWIDGIKVEKINYSLVAPHQYDVSKYLKPGQSQQITLQIDNRKFFEISDHNMGHAYTDHTQIMWNGVLGDIALNAYDAIAISDIQLYPNLASKTVKAKVKLKKNIQGAFNVDLSASIYQKNKPNNRKQPAQRVNIDQDEQSFELIYQLDEEIKPWDEFDPNLYVFDLHIHSKHGLDKRSLDFGFRDFKAIGNTFELNGRPIFMRGTLECNIFPLTGHPPMVKEEWLKVFKTAKQWGLNHIRFHSWCPPKAAFEAADEIGLYLQAELPVWALGIGSNQSAVDFLYAEAKNIIKEYGNHPSFMLWALGNELQGDMRILNRMVDSLKRMDNRHLYANTAYTFERGHGDRPEYNDDFLITQRTFDGWVRGQGVFNAKSPSFNNNYAASVKNINVPIVTHEIGQYAVYPNLNEIEKYTGVLDPVNFKAIKADLEKKGMLGQANDFLKSSGKLAALLYKEEIERALKTGGISGFQLLDLHDFPGQGTALVGLLDAFWDSKGIIEAEQFRQFNSPVVPLLQFDKATYLNTEIFKGTIALSNYGKKNFKKQQVEWRILDKANEIAKGHLDIDAHIGFNDGLGEISFPLSSIHKATELRIEVSLVGTEYTNQWSVWVYPSLKSTPWGNVQYTRDVDTALSLLQKGATVLLNPDWKNIQGLEGKFVPVFWSPVHFPKQAGTMGLLTDPNHPMFKDFPTDSHTDWQWWDLHLNSTTLIIDSLQGGNVPIQMIDNFANNRKLAFRRR